MSARKVSGLAMACALGFAASAPGAHAEATHNWHSFAPGKAACPGISWQFRSGIAEPYGYMWFNDISGVSRASGTLNRATGTLHMTVVSIGGKGPVGVIDGVRAPDGAFSGTLKGEGCSNLTILAPETEDVETGDEK